MGLTDDIKAAQSSRSVRHCPIATTLKKLPPEEHEALATALADEDIMHLTITEVLRKHGFAIGNRAVSNHRRLLCGCRSSK